jgi:hypothetical protein
MLRHSTLILTFSLREKELPLPVGEGWGEGGSIFRPKIYYQT